MLRLTDDELNTVRRFAEPLHPNDRRAYLERVTAILGDREIGPGSLHRACEQAQLELRRPPILDGRIGEGKYSR
jgi:hypothetical protein